MQLEIIESFDSSSDPKPIVSCNDFFPVMSLECSASVLSVSSRQTSKQRDRFNRKKWQTLHNETLFFFLPLFGAWDCLLSVARGLDALRFQRKRELMMKTITDVVFCTLMTQYYMDEQIFENPRCCWKGTPSSCHPWDIYAFGKRNILGMFNDRIIGVVRARHKCRRGSISSLILLLK